MKFSICIPNYNYAAYIGRTIQSVLDQGYPDFEVVVADNASTDRSAEVIRGFNDDRIRLRVNACNVGFAGNLDKAGAMATGQRMIMLSSDDLMRPGALETYRKLSGALGTRSERALVGSGIDVIDAEDGVTGYYTMDPKMWSGAQAEDALSREVGLPVFSLPADELLRRCLLLLRNPFRFASLCYPRALYETVEGYGGARLINPDKWFSWKLLSVAETAYHIDARLFAYRWHAGNQTAQQAQSGAIKHLVDQYAATFDLAPSVLERAGLIRADLTRAFIEQDVALRGLRLLADGQPALARRTLRFGQAAYPAEIRRNRKLVLLRLLLFWGPVGRLLAATVKEPAMKAWAGTIAANWREAGAAGRLRRLWTIARLRRRTIS